ncbi:type 1 glutamine amidotransferase [Psychrobacter sp. JB385]|uniref:type 1 glutamine amidotransferase n=1 Tax=Psychrobacter sp. JB385 TaxID=1434841 RepID=UPI00097E9526|nr:type 1 glutamine amidotransferase [Psychrobacter sp. JB385]SJN44444.1 Glutamine amidotransferase class-I [Psychrobacter sp. JB385]
MTLRIHALYHVDFEELSFIKQWADNKGHRITVTRFYENDPLPAQDSFDWLIIMGGPMSIHDENDFEWLADEKAFIQQSINDGKTVIGVCLGAQLIADSLGAKVAPSGIKEVGWLPIQLTEQGLAHPLLAGLPKNEFTVFHWHGDGFECPKGATPIATSHTWANQGFIYQTPKHKELDTWVLGWQCHFEVTNQSMVDMVSHGQTYIQEAMSDHPDSVQAADEILALGETYIADNNAWLSTMLDNLAK